MSTPALLDPTSYGRFALYIDGNNLYHTLRDLGLHIDYRRLLTYFRTKGWLVRAFYYTALLEGDLTPDWLVRLTDWLAYNGYEVVTKRAKVFQRRVVDEYGTSRWASEVKGNIDIELVVDMLTLAPQLDTIVLFTGNGDYVSVVEAAQRLKVRVVVVSSERTSESTIADELRRQADEFVDLVTIADAVKMPDRPVEVARSTRYDDNDGDVTASPDEGEPLL